jgi:hypothetical protein
MKKLFYFILLSAAFSFATSCIKEGPGGKASIKGKVVYNSTPVPGAVVYIKYGAKVSPGTDVTYYDASVNASATAEYEFTDLKRGDYYLFSVGFDSTLVQTVTGGKYVPVNSKTEAVISDLPVAP